MMPNPTALGNHGWFSRCLPCEKVLSMARLRGPRRGALPGPVRERSEFVAQVILDLEEFDVGFARTREGPWQST